jgi:hypothetical protein
MTGAVEGDERGRGHRGDIAGGSSLRQFLSVCGCGLVGSDFEGCGGMPALEPGSEARHVGRQNRLPALRITVRRRNGSGDLARHRHVK